MTRLPLALSALALAGWACGDPDLPAESAPAAIGTPDASVLLGTWQLDAATREWLPRACVRLAFPDLATPTFDVHRDEEALVVRLHTRDRLTWRARAQRRSFHAQQIVSTTESGRFCGGQTPVRLSLRAAGPDVLQGVWQTPGCDVCPDRPFGAQRVGAGATRTGAPPPP